jgi:hypothetical protein
VATTAAAVLAAALGVVAVPAPAQASSLAPWCGVAAPTVVCILSASRNGVPVLSTDPTYVVSAVEIPEDTPWSINWGVEDRGATTNDLGAGELSAVWTVTLDVRARIPRFGFAHSTPDSIVRSVAPSGDHLISFTGSPVTITQGCTGVPVCPSTAVSQSIAYIDGWVYDANWYLAEGVPQAAWNNANMWTNVDWTDFPPTITSTGAFQLDVANSHFLTDGATPVTGFVVQDLPYALVKQVMHVDDPASLVGGGVLATLSGTGGGTISITADDATGVVHVAAVGLTFSKRTITIRRGVIVPRAGVVKAAYRTTVKTRVRVGVAAGVSRGSRVTGYQARCYALRGTTLRYVRTATLGVGHGLTLTVLNVGTSGTRYCQVRVSSKAGWGPWSKAVKVRPKA